MRVLVDLKVVLDVLLDRTPHAESAAALWTLIEQGRAEGLIAAHAVTTLHYLAARAGGKAFAAQCVRDVLTVFAVAQVDGPVLEHALGLGTPDFEDAVCAAAAQASGCALVASRDPAGFRGCPLPVLDAMGAAAAIAAAAEQEGEPGPG